MRRRTSPGRVVASLALAGIALAFVAPVLVMLVGSLQPDHRVLVDAGSPGAWLSGALSLRNYSDVFRRVDFGRFLLNSVLVTGSTVAGGLLVNSLAAYALARLRWRGRRVALALVLTLVIVPFEAIAVPLFYQVSILGMRDTYLVQIVPFLADAFSIFLFYSFFLGMPRELEEAARLDGASVLRTYLSVIVPNARPVFASVAILTFLTRWSAFLWPSMVTIGPEVRPLPVAIATFHGLPPLLWGDILAFGVLMVAPVIVVFLLFQRGFVRGVAASASEG